MLTPSWCLVSSVSQSQGRRQGHRGHSRATSQVRVRAIQDWATRYSLRKDLQKARRDRDSSLGRPHVRARPREETKLKAWWWDIQIQSRNKQTRNLQEKLWRVSWENQMNRGKYQEIPGNFGDKNPKSNSQIRDHAEQLQGTNGKSASVGTAIQVWSRLIECQVSLANIKYQRLTRGDKQGAAGCN